MRAQLDLSKTIQKQRLTFKMTAEHFFKRLFNNVMWLTWISAASAALLNKNNEFGVFSVLFTLLTLWLIVGLFFVNKLAIISGTNKADNRKKIVEILNQKFPALQLNDSGQNIIQYRKNTSLFGWGKQIVIIFDDKNIYINMATIGRYDIRSPFHAISNYSSLRQLKEYF